ncbi:type IV toxin-antitoxin system AbiEi family antitoxin [Cellulomonas xiejunii]|uniref:Type IV toxin-antitoxin system AbiEi family antitoxin n=1 Tax=Cellulomonas xiejunii TaxID=2968083 RepID=A0ABY5KT22_9CELL|nr:type IV toxin-antitoxin system AbiEi family antitoxin [Cellulomonas xiejunii]MCC2323073.1 type IV toxin-antitoxin system AbiEi family antitoxin [Cellulomonas xiejunii]UUI73565.1 type IV toxin-antitoxin system AbiEi family antitoxin [Cellulomonas xiejunii]
MTLCDTTTTPAPLHRLRPRVAAPGPDVVRRDDVPPWAWTGLHLDGALVHLWRDTARVTGTPEDRALRASAFAPLVPRRGVVGRLSAAWVHAGGTPPDRVTVLVRSGARRPRPHPHRVSAEADLVDEDLLTVGGVLVTTLTRTAVDVARWVHPHTAVPVLRALVTQGLDPDDARRRIEAHAPGRGLRAARVTLRLV